MRALPALLLMMVLVAGCSGSSTTSTTGPTSDQTHIDLLDNRYDPTAATFKADQTAHFQNKGARTHTVTVHDADGKVLHDQTLAPGASDDFKFPGAGTFHVFCKLHDGMATQVTTTA
ncbi:MAG TPA: cupredoxin domain-containing protein [Candidatus Thermoplasmatota archaeon]|nr:cupredoxin domain-containing protein [Candidatus Thermoplasmatota archaeon]